MSRDWHVDHAGIARHLDAANPFRIAFQDDAAIVELYAPVGRDEQTPHDRDEVYLVIAGHGRFVRGGEEVAFAAGDLLHVPAGMPHRFAEFSADFRTWVIFYGKGDA